MRSTPIIAGLICTSFSMLAGGSRKGEVDLATVPPLHPHYQPEFAFDTTTDPARWDQQAPGLHAAFGSSDELYLRCEAPELNHGARIWEATGWKGERLNSQLLIWSREAQEQMRLRISDLTSENGEVIRKDRIRTHLVRYVLSNLPYQANGFTCDVPKDKAFLMPDRLEEFDRFDLPARTVRPVWLALDTPRDAAPGTYSSVVEVLSASGRAELQLKITVQDHVLPDPARWKFRLDLWQNPWAVSSYFQVTPWSEEHRALLRAHLRNYAEAGGKFITTYSVHSPWSDNSYVLEGAMIESTRTADGGWAFDYSVFDAYVNLAMECGIRDAITVYTPIPWGHRFRYLDAKSGSFVHVEWSPKSPDYRAYWRAFLDDLRSHLKEKGWFEKTYLGINENPLEMTLAAVTVIKEHSKEWKITYAGDWHAELSPLIDDYSVIITHEPDPHQLAERSRRGQTTTYYVCCNPPRPNNFVFSAPVESRYIGWYAAAYQYDGFLRWAYDAWPADPMRDARHTLWPAGDCFLVYPGGNSSIQFEKLREGIADFEKIRLLREMVAGSSSVKAEGLAKELDALLKRLGAERDYAKRDYEVSTVTGSVRQGRKLIENLSHELSGRK